MVLLKIAMLVLLISVTTNIIINYTTATQSVDNEIHNKMQEIYDINPFK